jgi:6-phosphogluconolactonase
MTPAAPASAVLRRVADAAAVARAAAEEVAAVGGRAIEERGRFTLALAGGSTPRRLYALLTTRDAPGGALRWDRVHVFFGDERHVPPEHLDSNFRAAREALLDHVGAGSVHRMRGEDPDAQAAASSYEAELEGFFGAAADRDPPPRFDLVLLGLGADGHTASLFPGSAALDERRRWVVAPHVEQVRARRITLTLPVLNRARHVLFLVSGAAKADAMARVFAAANEAAPPPAARVRPDEGALLWIADRAAAARVPVDPSDAVPL